MSTKIAASMTPSEQALLDLWDLIDDTRLKRSEAHAAILARRALAAATKEITLNARLKDIVRQRGYDLEKVQKLIDLFGGDHEMVERILAGRAKSHDDQHLKVAYKADAQPADAGDVEIPPEVDDALLALYEQLGSDWDAVIAQLSAPQAEELKRADPNYPPVGLVDQKKKSYDPATDPFAQMLHADQVGRTSR